MQTTTEIKNTLQDLKEEEKTLKAQLKENRERQKQLDQLKDAKVTYEKKTCSHCGESYLFKNIEGFISPNIVRRLVPWKGGVTQLFFGSGCDQCVKDIWEQDIQDLEKAGRIRREGNKIIPL